jgi:hypothetical protein
MIYVLLSIFLSIWSDPIASKYQSDKLEDYMQKLLVKDYLVYDFVIVYPVNENYMLDKSWIDGFSNRDQAFEEVLIVIVIREPKERSLLNEVALSRSNLVIDSLLHFDHSRIFYPAGQIFQKVEDDNYERVIIDIFSSYPNWTKLYTRYMN